MVIAAKRLGKSAWLACATAVAFGALFAPQAVQARVIVAVGVGDPWYGPPPPYVYVPPPVYVAPAPVYVAPAPVYVAPAPTYVAPAPTYVAPPVQPVAPAPSVASQGASWYYCSDPRGYYPYIQSCNGAWQQVPATAAPQGGQ